MAYTDIETIKKILQAMPKIFNNIENQELVLEVYEKSDLQYTDIDVDSEVVKIIRTVTPISENPTLNDASTAKLASDKIVPNTVVVANLQTLDTIYVENKDYIIDYTDGKISRATVGSSIPNNTAVYIWYIPFVQLTAASDYNIDIANGTVNRRAGTSIPDGARVYVDYSHSQGNVPDDTITECISQTESYMDTILKTEYIGSAENNIKSASTNHTLYLICLSMAQRALKIEKNTADEVAKYWIPLSEDYLKAFDKFIGPYILVSNFNAGDKAKNKKTTFTTDERSSFSAGKAK